MGRGLKDPIAGVAVALAAITITTLALFPLKEVAPVLSLGVVYLLAVLAIASRWGMLLGLTTAFVSAATFNFFHIPPTGRFTIANEENWVALAVFFVAAIFAAQLTERARQRADEAEQRRREADLGAELARLMLRGEDLKSALAVASHRLAATLQLDGAEIVAGAVDASHSRVAFPLRDGPSQLGTLLVPADADDGELTRVQERVVPVLEAFLAAALERDRLLTDRVETAALRRTDVLKTALLRSVSHDLRSPLTAIRAAAEPLAEAGTGQETRAELAAVVIEESDRLAALIDDLLDLSRLEAGAATPRPQSCSLPEVLQDAVDSLPPDAGEFNLRIADEVRPIEADPVQLARAFGNLLENSGRHAGGHPVSIRVGPLREGVQVRIVDRGPGIPSAQRERVFEPFFRSGTDDTGHRGSGLGLAIARGFIEVNGGRVWAESLPGQGTTFVTEFPLYWSPPKPEPLTAAGA